LHFHANAIRENIGDKRESDYRRQEFVSGIHLGCLPLPHAKRRSNRANKRCGMFAFRIQLRIEDREFKPLGESLSQQPLQSSELHHYVGFKTKSGCDAPFFDVSE
jgi:hypothetical protein